MLKQRSVEKSADEQKEKRVDVDNYQHQNSFQRQLRKCWGFKKMLLVLLSKVHIISFQLRK